MCAVGHDELDAVIQAMLPRLAEAAGADSTTLVTYGHADGDTRTYRCASPSLGVDTSTDEATASGSLWDQLQLPAEPLVLERIPGDLPREAMTPHMLDYLRQVPLQSAVVIPVAIAGERICLLALEAREHRSWSRGLVARLRLFAEILATGLYRRQQGLRLELQVEPSNDEHRRQSPSDDGGDADAPASSSFAKFDEIVGASAALRTALRRVQEVASSKTTVLLRGETGTGKELFARAIHSRSSRRARPFVVINCAALPPSLIESELFGHTRGAFTGAVTTRQGRFELAHRGTLFLDEIGDLPLDLQTKLLRVLQEGTFERLGSSQTQSVDVRIVAATHRDLRRMISEGTFREDLFYRLSVFPIRLPALRERREDVPELVWAIIRRLQRLTHHHIRRVPDAVMTQLVARPWPGNVRELENVIERAIIHTTGETLMLLEDNLDMEPSATEEDATTLAAIERTHIQEVLRACGWRINGTGNAAERLGLHPNTLRFRMKKLGIVREEPPRAHVHAASA